LSVTFNKNGVVIANPLNIDNVYTGEQYNKSNMSLTYNCETDVFKDYGFSTALKLTPTNTSTSAFMAYSYLCDPTIVYDTSQVFSFSMYVYVSEDCNANFRLNLEHSNTWIKNYKNTTANINETTKGKVIWAWGTFKVNSSDGKMYIMFYPNPNSANVFTTGYQLIAGIKIYKGEKKYLSSDFYGFSYLNNGKTSISENGILSNDFIEI
jgi:hypothetical protein